MTVISQDTIRELAGFTSGGAPVVSCYLDVDGRSQVRAQDYQAELARLLREAKRRLDTTDDVQADFDKLAAHVGAGIDRSGVRGLAMFSCAAADLWAVYPLPLPVRSRLVVNDVPAVSQLEAMLQDYGRLAVLLVDRQRTRLFLFELGQLVERTELVEELPRHYDSRGHGDAGYEREQHHTDELVAQHLRHAAGAAFELLQGHGFEHLAIGAPAQLLHDLEAALHPYLRERLRGTVHLEPSAGLDDVRRAALEVEAEIDRAREAGLIGHLRDQVAADAKGVAGLDAVLAALRDHRVERLFVSAGFGEAGWRCGACGALASVGRGCPACGEDMAHIDDVVEEAVEEALVQHVRVEICVGNADLDVLGRIGALLRY